MLGENIFKLRTEKNLTQEDLAEKIGVTQMAVSYYERGFKMPAVEVLSRIADALECSVDTLLDRKI